VHPQEKGNTAEIRARHVEENLEAMFQPMRGRPGPLRACVIARSDLKSI
jgi:hypothetical protein